MVLCNNRPVIAQAEDRSCHLGIAPANGCSIFSKYVDQYTVSV